MRRSEPCSKPLLRLTTGIHGRHVRLRVLEHRAEAVRRHADDEHLRVADGLREVGRRAQLGRAASSPAGSRRSCARSLISRADLADCAPRAWCGGAGHERRDGRAPGSGAEHRHLHAVAPAFVVDFVMESSLCNERSSSPSTRRCARASVRGSTRKSCRTTSSGRRPGIVPHDAVRRGRAPRLPRHGDSRGVRRRRRRRLPLQPRHRRGDPGRGRRRRRPRHHAAQRHLPAVLPALLHRRAAGAVAARHRVGRARHRDRDDRARHRLRPRVDVDDRDPRRRRVRRQRLEDVHHQRHQRRPRDHRGQDRSDAAAQGHVAARPRARHGRASSAAATSRSSGCTRRTPPSCSSPTSPCPVDEPARRGGRGLPAARAQPAAGAAVDRGRRASRPRAPRSAGRSTT